MMRNAISARRFFRNIGVIAAVAIAFLNQAHAQIASTATASSAFQAASLAVDGNQSSRWESSHGVSPSWLTLDLGGAYDVTGVTIDWEAANAANYAIEGSNDNSQWTTLASFTDGAFGSRSDTLALSGSYRYVRMYATERSAGNYWGYSIFEMQVSGSASVSEFSGATEVDGDSAEFYINSSSWADIHYKVNNGLQQNVRMTQSGGRNSLEINGLAAGDLVDYNFTYWNTASNSQIDTAWQVYSQSGTSIADSDNDGVGDNVDQCVGTPAGAVVDSDGCALDSDGDGISDGIDQCVGTPAGASVNGLGCPSDTDGDGVLDGLDQCPGTHPAAVVDGDGCSLDADGDGVFDSVDQCPGTASGAIVDASGCETASGLSGATQINGDSVELFINTGSWADVHYKVNNGLQQNVRMTQSGGRNSLTINGMANGDVVAFNFTYWDTDLNRQIDTAWQNYTVGGTSVADADNDGVADGNDLCANTPAGAVVDVSGCPLDSDGDGVSDGIDQCASTPAGATVNGLGCPLDSDNDGVLDGIDQCPGTTSGASVDTDGCELAMTQLSATASASSEFQSASLAVDGNQATRWESSHGASPSVLTLDLNGAFELSEVVIYWEAANASTYTVQGSNDNSQWTTLASFTGGAFGDRTDNHLVAGVYRYVRMNATSRSAGNYWGYSIFEMEVYGSPAATNPDSDNDGVDDSLDQCPNTPAATTVDSVGCAIIVTPVDDEDSDGVVDAIDQCPGTPAGSSVNSQGCSINIGAIVPLYSPATPLEPVVSFVRSDGVVVTRLGDRGRDRHAKDIGYYDPNNIFNSDHYDHWLAHYWEYRTARVQFEDHVPNGQSLIRATYITESQLSAREFRVWFSGVTTTGQFHFNPAATYVGRGTWNNDFVKVSDSGHQFMYTVDITEQWKNVATFNTPLQTGVNMEFEISQFLAAPPAGARKNYYGTSYVYVIGTPGMAPFEWDRNANDPLGSNDGSPIAAEGLLGGATTLGYNYSEEPAGRFIEMATNLSPGNAQPFVEGRRVHHNDFETGVHDERADNPIWTEQSGKLGKHYINASCAKCHVRNGRALVANPGEELDKWIFKVGDTAGYPDPLIGRVLQPAMIGSGTSEGSVTLGAWTTLANGLRQPNYVFGGNAPQQFSARIAPQLVGLGLLEAVSEDTIMEWADPNDTDGVPGVSGRASLSEDPVTGVTRLGRFGYKASTSSVQHQVASALNTDMGVMTSVLPSPDCGASQTDCGNASGSELADEHLDDLVKYISLLGVPARRDLNDGVALQGEALFGSTGCAACHRPEMQTSAYAPLTELRNQTIRPYTDMLLHDMGPGLADNLGDGTASGSEWRTAPLWGLGHTVSVMIADAKANDLVSMARSPDDINRIGYLHDGRARTIDEAIRWHGGEAQSAQSAYESLNVSDQQALIAFLKSL